MCGSCVIGGSGPLANIRQSRCGSREGSGSVEQGRHGVDGVRASVIPQDDVAVRMLRALRRILRAVDIHSHHLSSRYGVTGPQLVALLTIVDEGDLTTTEIGHHIHVSASTVVGIVDRLERKGFVRRVRDSEDRRKVRVVATEQGEQFVRDAPSPLQETVLAGISGLSELERSTIALSLERVVDMMEAGHIDASPVLESGPIIKGDQ